MRSIPGSILVVGIALVLSPPASAQDQNVQSFALNGHKRVLDGQWQGIRYASDGNVYFGSSTHSAHHGAAFFKYNPLTGEVTMLAEDLSVICGEDPGTNPQGKLHSDIVEANGWLYMSTHFSSEKPGDYGRWSGAHVIGYELATGAFRDYGVVHPNYTSYSAVGVDPSRNLLYVFVTGQNPIDVSYLYRIDTVSGAKTNLGQVGGSFAHSFWMFVDRRGDAWFSVGGQNGALRRVRGATGTIDVYPNALPPMYRWDVEQIAVAGEQSQRVIMWMQPLDGDRAVFTLGWSGGMLYLFDSTKPIGSGQEFQIIKHIGYSDQGLTVAGNRVFYYQRANRGFGHQEAQDFHLLSVSLNPAAGYPITDYGLIKDQDGRVAWRLPGMASDGDSRLFMIGDWWTVAGDLGTLRYRYNGGAEFYEQLPRGEFFAIADVGSSGTAELASLILSPTVVYGGSPTVGNQLWLNGPAPPGGASVVLTSSDPSAATPPDSVFIAEGLVRSEDFTIATSSVPYDKSVTISASYGRFTRNGTVTVAAGATATFLRVDSTTRGNWQGAYGGGGYVLVNQATNLPPSAQVTTTGNPAWTWSASTTDARALQKVGAADRIAATWYAAGTATVSAEVSFSDALPHQVAIYAVDFDLAARRQRVEVLEAATGVVLDSREMSSFTGGQYLVYRVMGRVRFRLTRLQGVNAVLSALFIDADGSSVNTPPTVSLIEPAHGAAFTAPPSIRLKASAADSDGTIAKVEFFDGTAVIGTATAAPYQVDWANPSVGTHTLWARATDDDLAPGDSAPVTINVNSSGPGGGSATATFLRLDSTTRGNWQGVYGGAGYLVVDHATNLPAFAQATPTGHSPWTWSASTADTRALQKTTATDRVAAAWYTSGATSVVLELNFTDGQPHQAAIYAVDWDNVGRRQRVEVLDASSNTVFDSREMSGFNGGQYLVYRLSGRVRIRLTKVQGVNAVLSALFVDPDGGALPNAAPTVSLIEPAPGATLTSPPVIRLKATAGDIDGTVTKVEFFAGAALVGTATVAPYEVDWPNPPSGNHSLRARATDDDSATQDSAVVAITVGGGSGGATSASFVRVDATTRGSWQGAYGAEGYLLVNHAAIVPAFAQVTPAGQSTWTWSASTGDSRALQKVVGTDRTAQTWYATGAASMTVEMTFNDQQPHRVALYSVDWESNTRRQRVDVIDAATGAVLDSREMSSFNGGQYVVYRVSGHVRFRLTRTAGTNAVLSALFIDPAGS